MVPQTWDMSLMVDGYCQVTVDDWEEYKLVSTKFHETSGNGVKIIEVSRKTDRLVDTGFGTNLVFSNFDSVLEMSFYLIQRLPIQRYFRFLDII